MSELLASSARPLVEVKESRSSDHLVTMFSIVMAIGFLYFGRDVFVPLAIAILLSFVLSPPIRLVRKFGLGRHLAVWTIVLTTLLLIFALSMLVTKQVAQLSDDLPKYQHTISEKIEKLRSHATDNQLFEKLTSAAQSLGDLGRNPAQQVRGEEAFTENQRKPLPVVIYQPAPGAFAILETIGANILAPLATIGLVAVYLVFILLQREDLRDRFIRLAGSHDLHRMTKAMNDAASRLSRYFLVQTMINAGFGLFIGSGLAIIGVPSPILWGMLAFFMRFLPYIGSTISAFFPVVLAAAVDPGWSMAIESLALFLVVEPILGQVVEPLLYGSNTGLSPISIIVSATVWTWLWGPVGLVLATPLTVCLVVLGRNVERLNFLDILFGDAPALTPQESFYQRMLANDTAEMTEAAERILRQESLIAFYDSVALPALAMAQIDVRRGVLEENRQAKIKHTIDELIENLSDYGSEPARKGSDTEKAEKAETTVKAEPPVLPALETNLPPIRSDATAGKTMLCIAGRNTLDSAVTAIFAQLSEKQGFIVHQEGASALTLPEIPRIVQKNADLIILSYLDAESSFTNARYAIRRLRRHLPRAKIVAAFWETCDYSPQELCENLGSNFCAMTLADALAYCLTECRPKELSEKISEQLPRVILPHDEGNPLVSGTV